MFGNKNMQEMMAKMQEMQGAVEDSKKRLETICVKGEAFDGKVRFVMDGNRKLQDLFIDDEIYDAKSKDEMITALLDAFNQAIKNADHVNESELKSTALNIIPTMGK
jgi:DNA-binding YbaB/EbfC family protein